MNFFNHKCWVWLLVCVALVACESQDPFAGESNKGPFPSYPELPAQVSNSDYVYVSHDTQIGNRTVRNFSLCFDKTKFAARWVAYPLHGCYNGSATRYDARHKGAPWPQDPKIPSNYQHSGGTYGRGYARGHQIPAADRDFNEAMNDQTFYMSNITPQDYDFNDGIWLKLENKIRDYTCLDTLYVVTGAHWEEDYSLVGSIYPVPTHYYKAVLRTRTGNSGKSVYQASREELKCIAFWFSHSATGSLTKAYCVSVEDLERLTGFEFFPTIDVDKSECVPADWGFGY